MHHKLSSLSLYRLRSLKSTLPRLQSSTAPSTFYVVRYGTVWYRCMGVHDCAKRMWSCCLDQSSASVDEHFLTTCRKKRVKVNDIGLMFV